MTPLDIVLLTSFVIGAGQVLFALLMGWKAQKEKEELGADEFDSFMCAVSGVVMVGGFVAGYAVFGFLIRGVVKFFAG